MAGPNISITIRTGDKAFTPEPDFEVARILRELADNIELHGIQAAHNMMLYDVHNNRAGAVSYHPKEH